MPVPFHRSAALVRAVLPALALALAAAAAPARAATETWVSTWAAAPALGGDGFGPATNLDDQTVRHQVHLSTGGSRLRLRLSNEFGGGTVDIGGVQVALSAGGGAIVPGSAHALTFGGAARATMVPGAPLVSDPVDWVLPAQADLVVDVYVPGNVPHKSQTWHAEGHQTTYLAKGNALGAASFPAKPTSTARFFLSGIETVPTPSRYAQTLVTIGDSITDGSGEDTDTNQRWPDFLATRLQATGTLASEGVANEGFGGNHLLITGSAPPVPARFDRDVLTHPSARYVVVLIGINDIGAYTFGNGSVSSAGMIAAYQQLIARAHAHGLRIYGATLTPMKGSLYFSTGAEQIRSDVNAWIRTSGAWDAVIDFDAAVRDPADPQQLLPAYSADNLHPNAAGYQAMADSIDLRLFAKPGN